MSPNYVVVRTYYEEGNKEYEAEYQNGEKHGKEIWRWIDGNIQLKLEYQNGKLIKRTL
jgi:antitoxin component YwqK of YwqJK toxin-antitoxin module